MKLDLYQKIDRRVVVCWWTFMLSSVAFLVLALLPSLPGAASDRFEDVSLSDVFHDDINWLASAGVTKGCNPPANDRFCPGDPVTRGQMAAFLHRALPDLPVAGSPAFVDTSESVFEADIVWLAQAGVTKGCNPPDNDRFCPDDPVTRGQMAAFLVRALKLPIGGAEFTDTADSVFISDIAALAEAGITRGCNPPDNTHFCPADLVTRAQMAAFLSRALSQPPLPVLFNKLSSGSNHACAVSTEGPTYCWGLNARGQIGNGETGGGSFDAQEPAPVRVTGEHTFMHVSAGAMHTCGLTESREVYCWGAFDSGGTGTSEATEPEKIEGLEAIQISSGMNHTCAVAVANEVYCWGQNYWGQLGDGTQTSRSSPVKVAAPHLFVEVSAGGGHTCGVTTEHELYCWGGNEYGALGTGIDEDTGIGAYQSAPVRVAGDEEWVRVSAGEFHTCGVTVEGSGYCWGANGESQLGDGNPSLVWKYEPGPVPVSGAQTWNEIRAAYQHTCGVTTTGEAYCWGFNYSGELGIGSDTEQRIRPVKVVGGLTFQSVDVGGGNPFSCGVTSDGRGYCWGSDSYGQLGDGSRVSSGGFVATPQEIRPLR